MMSANTLVFGARPVVDEARSWSAATAMAVKANVVVPFGVASLMIVIEPGKMTASADSERSWLPPVPSRSIRRVWYGEPEIATAELLAPQSWRVAMWPPQARTGLAHSRREGDRDPGRLVTGEPGAVRVRVGADARDRAAEQREAPATGVTPAPVTCGSAGIGKVVEQRRSRLTPRHGLAVEPRCG